MLSENLPLFTKSCRKPTWLATLNLVFAHAMYWTGWVTPVGIVYGLHFQDPCKPSLAGCQLLEECRSGTSSTGWAPLIRIGVYLANHSIWSFGIHVSVFVIGGLQILATSSLKDYTELVWSASNPERAAPFQKGLLFRQLHLLFKLANLVQQRELLGVLILAGILAHSFSLTVLIQLEWSAKNVLPLFTYLLSLLDAMLAVVVYLGGLAEIHSAVRKLKHLQVKRGGGVREEKWWRKFHASCPLLQLKFGVDNYVDETTPIICLNHACELTMQLLLIKA